MSDGHCFISYSNADGLEFATKLAIELESGQPFVKVWFDKNEMSSSGGDWDEQLASAISACKCLLFVMSVDSTAKQSNCKEEWTWALKCKKPVICISLNKKAEDQFRLNNRQKIDFTSNFEAGIAQLRKAIERLDSEEGKLDELNHRLAEANRDLHRATNEDRPRIQAEIEQLKADITVQQKIVDDPKGAEDQTQKNIEAGLERERQPEKPVAGKTSTRFINPPPGIAPTYFQDRLIETKQIADFLHNDAQRLMTIVGRAGVGKTAMICRLLKGIENGQLPDDLGDMRADGIVYLSEAGSHRINFANIFADLSKLLPKETAESLDDIYKNPQTSTGDKMRKLLDAFESGRFILLLDNFEDLIDSESLQIKDSELSNALNVLLQATQHTVKVIITTRIAPRDLALVEPGRQHPLSLDEGLESPYAENVLREMDSDGHVGLMKASDELLGKARIKTRGYPRALEALYAILSVDRYTTLEELLKLELPKEVVEKLVGEAFSRLDITAQKVMQALAVYNRPVSPAAIDYLLQPHSPSIDSAMVLNRLVNMHFARREAGRYYLHPVDRKYAFSIISNKKALTVGALQMENIEIQKELLSSLHASRFNEFTQHDLLTRAADYFAQARKPRGEWKNLDNLTAQLAELELRCEARDFNTAASVLNDIEFDYLLLWGHYHLLINLHEKLSGKILDNFIQSRHLKGMGHAYRRTGQVKRSVLLYEESLEYLKQAQTTEISFPNTEGRANSELVNMLREEGDILTGLGNTCAELGNTRKAIEYYEKALVITRKIGNHKGEGADLNNLGNRYASLGDIYKAIKYYEDALIIAKKIGDRKGEGNRLSNLGNRYSDLGDAHKSIKYFGDAVVIAREIGDRKGEANRLSNIGLSLTSLDEYKKAQQYFQEAIQIADAISYQVVQLEAHSRLAQAYLFQDDLVNAYTAIGEALQYNVPKSNHNATALHGIIALRQGERETAQMAFMKSIAQADEILAKTPDFYSALDAKGLALSGLAICRGAVPAPDDAPVNTTGRGDPAPTINDAIETFRKARKIAPHAGVVKSVLRLFDELIKCDSDGILKDVRDAAEGKAA